MSGDGWSDESRRGSVTSTAKYGPSSRQHCEQMMALALHSYDLFKAKDDHGSAGEIMVIPIYFIFLDSMARPVGSTEESQHQQALQLGGRQQLQVSGKLPGT